MLVILLTQKKESSGMRKRTPLQQSSDPELIMDDPMALSAEVEKSLMNAVVAYLKRYKTVGNLEKYKEIGL